MAKILVVDNNETLARLIEEVLLTDGHQVALAGDGGGALRLVEAGEFDVAFIDLVLPDFCGLEILKTFRRKGHLTVPIIISGQVDINCAIASINAGVFHYLRKPFDIDDISKIAGAAIQQKGRLARPSRAPSRAAQSDGNSTASGTAIKLGGDLLIATIALMAGFVGIGEYFDARRVPYLWSKLEVAYLVASFACCFVFVYFNRGLKTGWANLENASSKKAALKGDFINLIFSYVLFAAVLFFVTSYTRAGYAILAGAGLGLAAFWLKNRLFLPGLARFWQRSREGRKKITIKSAAVQTEPGDSEREESDQFCRAACSHTCLKYNFAPQNQASQKGPAGDYQRPNITSSKEGGIEIGPSRLINDLFGSRIKNAKAENGIKEGVNR